MKRKSYQKPVTKFELGIATQMLAVSIGALRSGYGDADEQTWGDGNAAKEYSDPNTWEDDWEDN